MRVLFCTLDYPPSAVGSIGGAENQARLQAEELVRRGHMVHVVCARAPGTRSEVVEGVVIHRLPRLQKHRLRTVSYLLMLFGFLILRLRRFDLVHIHLANLQADVAVSGARLLRRPSYVKVAAGGPLGEVGRMRKVALLTRYTGLRKATRVQAISDEIAADLASIGVPESRIVRIPNGVRVPGMVRSEEGRIRSRDALHLPQDGVLILYVGRLERDKGVEELLGLWRDGSVGSAILLLVGSPGIKNPVGVDRLPAGVRYLGWAADLTPHYAAADIFVLPSHAEGMSNALLEALVSGVPAVATRVGAAPEMIHDGRDGLLVDPGNRNELRAALVRLVADEAERLRLGDAGQRSASKRYGIESVVTQIESAYRSIVVRR